jgi:hypothetical protein
MKDPIPQNQRATSDLVAKEADSLAQARNLEPLAWCRDHCPDEVGDLVLCGSRKRTLLLTAFDLIERPRPDNFPAQSGAQYGTLE